MNVLSVVWFGAAISGAVAAVVAVFLPSVRQQTLLVAGVSFAIAGVLGISSIGVFFIGLAAFCFSRRGGELRAGSAPPPPVWPRSND